MKENDFFENSKGRLGLKIYAILKRERVSKSLLARPKNFDGRCDFSWPPRQNFGRVCYSLCRRVEDRKK